jgi:streptogramin lyase
MWRWPALLVLAGVAAGGAAFAQIQEFTIPTPNSGPLSITPGPDGNLWFTEIEKVGRITVGGQITEFPPAGLFGFRLAGIVTGPDGNLWVADNASTIFRVNTSGRFLGYLTASTETATAPGFAGICVGVDGNVWYVEQNANRIGRMTPGGSFVEFPLPAADSFPTGIASGADGGMWFTEGAGRIGRISSGGLLREFPVPPGWGPSGIALGPDGNIWFTDFYQGHIGRITPDGLLNGYPVRNGNDMTAITAGPDGALWFTDSGNNAIGRIIVAAAVTEFPIPTADSAPEGIASGPDGAIWFTEAQVGKIGRLTVPSMSMANIPTLSIAGLLVYAIGLAVVGRFVVARLLD